MCLIILLFSWFMQTPVYASVVYKCIKPSGAIQYQGKQCLQADDQQRMDITYNTVTLPKKPLKKTAPKREARKSKGTAKKEQQNKKRHLRLRAQCERVTRQIEEISQLYRTGYTVKRGIILDRKLAEYKDKKRKYCNNE